MVTQLQGCKVTKLHKGVSPAHSHVIGDFDIVEHNSPRRCWRPSQDSERSNPTSWWSLAAGAMLFVPSEGLLFLNPPSPLPSSLVAEILRPATVVPWLRRSPGAQFRRDGVQNSFPSALATRREMCRS